MFRGAARRYPRAAPSRVPLTPRAVARNLLFVMQRREPRRALTAGLSLSCTCVLRLAFSLKRRGAPRARARARRRNLSSGRDCLGARSGGKTPGRARGNEESGEFIRAAARRDVDRLPARRVTLKLNGLSPVNIQFLLTIHFPFSSIF